ncbi:hypothetical protein FI667_g14360, partial [Globisporangium splendens]
MKRVLSNPTVTRAASSVASEAAALRRSADASLAEKFNLATLNGGKNPFEVSSNTLLKPNAANKKKTEKDVKDVYSLEYLLGGSDAKKTTAKSKNPFDVASSKLM